MSQNTWSNLLSSIATFGTKIEAALSELSILDTCKNLPIDHACVRLANSDNVTALKVELNQVGTIISSVNVNGREISITQLNVALNLGSWTTHGVELPHPKPNHSYEDGWEHVEFVLTGAENSMNSLREKFLELFDEPNIDYLKEKYSYSEDEPHADGDQLPNPTIGLKVGTVGIKFHALPIQQVVGYTS